MQGQEMTFIGNRASAVTSLLLALVLGAVGVWALLFEHPILGIVICSSRRTDRGVAAVRGLSAVALPASRRGGL